MAPRAAVARRTRGGAGAKLLLAADPEGTTYLAEQYAPYPFHVCRPHRYEGDPAGMATVTLQSLSGGIYEGERLSLELATAPLARAHVTTQASTIVHSMKDGWADMSVTLEAGAGSLLEYLPDPMILFPGARLESRILAIAHPEASLIISDAFLGHDPGGAGGTFDRLLADVIVRGPGGRLHARDRFLITGEEFHAASPARGAQATVLAITRAISPEVLVARLREGLEARPELTAGASALPGGSGAWARIMAPEGAHLTEAMAACWRAVRQGLTGTTPPMRRK